MFDLLLCLYTNEMDHHLDKFNIKAFFQEVLDWIAAESSGDHTIEIVTDNMLDQVGQSLAALGGF